MCSIKTIRPHPVLLPKVSIIGDTLLFSIALPRGVMVGFSNAVFLYIKSENFYLCGKKYSVDFPKLETRYK